MKTTYPMSNTYKDAAIILRQQAQEGKRPVDLSETTIRTLVNDLLDAREKDGYKVNHSYSQKVAIQQVRNISARMDEDDERYVNYLKGLGKK